MMRSVRIIVQTTTEVEADDAAEAAQIAIEEADDLWWNEIDRETGDIVNPDGRGDR